MPRFVSPHGVFAFDDTPSSTPASGPAVVFLHGMLGSTKVWSELAPHVAGRRQVAVDLPGHGQSDPLRQGRSLDDLAADLASLIAHLGLEKPLVVGLSLGANLALRLALDHPDHVGELTLCSAHADAETEASLAQSRSTMQAAAKLGAGPVLRALAGAMLGPTTRKTRPYVLERCLREVTELRVPAILPLIEAALTRPDLKPRLPSLRVPTLVARGAEDSLVTPSQAADLATTCHAPLVTLPGVGHLAPLEDPAAFAALLRAPPR